MAKVYIVTPNIGIEFLELYFSALFIQTYQDFKVCFIDNTLDNSAVDYIKEDVEIKDKVIIIHNSVNNKFAKSMNQGIKEAFKDDECRYIIALNNDTFIAPNFIQTLVEKAEQRLYLGSVQGLMLTGSSEFVDNKGLLYSKNGLGFGIDSNKLHDAKDDGAADNYILGTCAGACLYKRNALEKIEHNSQYFDEVLEAYYDDIDVAIRLQKAGFTSLYTADTTVNHYKNIMLNKNKVYYACRNKSLVAYKNMTKHYYWQNILYILLADLLQVVYYTFKGYPISIKAKFEAYKLIKNKIVLRAKPEKYGEMYRTYKNYIKLKWR